MKENKYLNAPLPQGFRIISKSKSYRFLGFTLAEVLMAKRESGNKCLRFISRKSEPKESTSNMKFKVAFTLAEVLITLAIIGIVAALTIPTVVQNYKKHEASTRLKKFYSNMINAVRLSEVDQAQITCKWKFYSGGGYQKSFFNEYLAPYLKYIKIEDGTYWDYEKNADKLPVDMPGYTVYFADGTAAGVAFNDNYYFDINGKKKPNEYGKDIFAFFIISDCDEQYAEKDLINKVPRFNTVSPSIVSYESDGINNVNSRTYNKNYCASSSSINNRWYCTRLLELDGWEFKSDYPYKL